MEKRAFLLRRTGLLAIACAVAMTALACAFALPVGAVADEAAVVAHSGEGDQRVNYTSIADAMNASYTGATIVMDTDWDMGKESLDIPSGKTCTIDLNGHRITGSGVIAICMMENSNLKLTSSASYADFSYRGYAKTDGDLTDQTWGWQDLTVNAGGLVTNTAAKSGQGISVADECKLEIENIAVAGCPWNGIRINGSSTVDLTNATVCHNMAGHSTDSSFGGGVFFASYRVTLNMTNSHIDDNYANNGAGGVFVSSESTLNMERGSTISRNAAGDGGGGILCGSGAFTIKSEDGTGTIEGNASLRESAAAYNTNKSGGGIHVNSTKGTNSGLIEGVTIKGNYAGYDGGGVELDQRGTRLVNCKIIGNSARLDGGGVFVYNDNNSIEGCEIRDNWCGGGYEGGGVFVSYHYDVKMTGTCVVKGNTRGEGSGNADDVFLSTLSGGGGKAYITGSLAKGSTVGVRTGITDDRRIAKNFKPASKDCLFYDMSGYYVSYGSDEGGDAWQRHTAVDFAVSIDGKAYGRYRNGSAVALTVPATKGGGKVFWRWDTQAATGLYPLSDYFGVKGAYSNALAFTMPQNDVSLVPIYINHVTAVRFQVEAPEAGRALATSGKLWRSDGGASLTQTVPCSVYWYEVDEDGNVSETSATGLAKANTAYKAYLAAPEAGDLGFFYDEEVSVAVSLVSASGDLVKEPKVTKSYLTLSNSLAAHVDDAYTTGAGSGEAVKTGTIKVQMMNQGLLGGGGAAAAAMALDDGGDGDVQSDLGTAEVSYAYDDDTQTVTIAAPAKEGYNFCNWEVAGAAEVSDEGAVTLPVSELLKIESLTAVYTPVVTQVEVEMNEPAPAAGEKLATGVKALVLTGSDGSTLDLVEAIDAGERPVTWSPEPDDGLADYSTAYTALVELTNADGLEDVEKVLANGAKVSVTAASGAVDAEAAGFTVVDGKLCLAVSFAKTADLKAVSVEQPADVEVSFEDACAGEWGLPKTVEVKLQNGETAEGDVTWEAVEGFDAGAPAAQVLTAKGAVAHVAYDGELDTGGLDTAVTVTVRVAAPAKQAEDDAAKTETTTVTETKTASKKGTPATGDATWGGIAGLLALAVVCLAAARVSLRKNR